MTNEEIEEAKWIAHARECESAALAYLREQRRVKRIQNRFDRMWGEHCAACGIVFYRSDKKWPKCPNCGLTG
jgi:rubrerythrin